jgi:hypothetical protein
MRWSYVLPLLPPLGLWITLLRDSSLCPLLLLLFLILSPHLRNFRYHLGIVGQTAHRNRLEEPPCTGGRCRNLAV